MILPYMPYSPIYAFSYGDCTSVQTFRAIGPLFMEILHFNDLGDTSLMEILHFEDLGDTSVVWLRTQLF